MHTSEQRLARTIMGGDSNPLMTDGYKFSMAQAGFPLREETFYFTCRKGNGPLFIPCDLAEVVREFLPKNLPGGGKQRAFLETHGYGMTSAMEAALMGQVKIWCAPKGSWVLPGEPIVTLTGPSFLVSWAEPLVISLHFILQVATAFRLHGVVSPRAQWAGELFHGYHPSCQSEANIVRIVANMVGYNLPLGGIPDPDPGLYREIVTNRAKDVRHILGGRNSLRDRTFEVGMRAMTCMAQHRMALEVWQGEGLVKTSNLFLAWHLYMVPVGTTGHEHQMRWAAISGGGDEAGFRAVRDMRKEPPSYLFDTIHPTMVGIPAMIRVMREDPTRTCSVRFDSGNQEEQLRIIHECEEFGNTAKVLMKPNYIFEDGYDAAKTARNEELRESLRIPTSKAQYGYGGFAVHAEEMNPFGRDAVSAAYKLTQTGGVPVMKHSGSPGKQSIPGKPVILRRGYGTGVSIIAQEGEVIPEYAEIEASADVPDKTELSPQTRDIEDALIQRRQALIQGERSA